MLSPSAFSNAPPVVMLSETSEFEFDFSGVEESELPELSDFGSSELDESKLEEPVTGSDTSSESTI